MYSDTVRRLVAELPNRGEMEHPSHVGAAENPICGDFVRIYLRRSEDRIEEARFQASGCPATIASAAAITELVSGTSLSFCRTLTLDDVLEYLESLPKPKRHGAEVALHALQSALSE